MGRLTLEHSALQYLNQWLAHDRQYCAALASTDEKGKFRGLKDAAQYYGVARNLPKRFDIDRRFGPLLDILDRQARHQFVEGDGLVDAIRAVAADISRAYGERRVLSLTTKFLWLKFQRPIIVYDKQARLALVTRDGHLGEFYARWRDEFKERASSIHTACEDLKSVTEYSVDPDLASEELHSLSAAKWFHERVFDRYLWRVGANRMKSTL